MKEIFLFIFLNLSFYVASKDKKVLPSWFMVQNKVTMRPQIYRPEHTLCYSAHVSNKGAITFRRRRSDCPRLLFSMAMSARSVSSKEQYTIRDTNFHSIYNFSIAHAVHYTPCYAVQQSLDKFAPQYCHGFKYIRVLRLRLKSGCLLHIVMVRKKECMLSSRKFCMEFA